MKAQFTLLLLLTAIIGFSCRKAAVKSYPITGSYLIIGHRGGFAGPGAPAPYYLINNGQLRKDNSHNSGNVPDDYSGFNFNIVLPTAAYNQVAGLQNTIPSELLAKNNADIGTAAPDAGVLEVRTSINNVTYRWIFEYDLSGTSQEIRDFVSRANGVFSY